MDYRLLKAVLWSGLIFGPVAQAQAIEWTIQAFQEEGSMPLQTFRAVAERLASRSTGRLTINVLPAGGVVPNDGTPRAIDAGLLHGHYNAPYFFAAMDPAFAVLGDTLGAFEDPLQRDRWFTEGGGNEITRRLYAAHGLYFVGPVYWPSDWMPSIVPLDDLQSLNGLRIRAPGGPVGTLLRLAGAEVVNLPASQTHEALASGEIDATDWSDLGSNDASGLYQIAPYNTLLRHSMVVTEISVGLETWADLPADLKPLMTSEVAAFSVELARNFQSSETELLDRLAAGGGVSAAWSYQDSRPWRDLVARVQDEWRERSAFAREIIDSQQTFLEKVAP